MKDKFVATLIVVILISSVLMITVPTIPVSASPAEIHVPGDYSTIQNAVGNATSGDTIIVAAGTYDEQVVIDKSLTLEGAGDTTIIQPSAASVLTTVKTTPWLSDATKQMAAIVFADTYGGSVTVKNLKIDGTLITIVPSGVGGDWVAGLAYLETSGTIESLTVIGNPNLACRTCGIWASAMSNASTVEVTLCTVEGYNRAGIYAIGETMTADYNYNEINGPNAAYTGPQVPNGIFFLVSVTGSATYNTVTDLSYTGETYRSTGIGTYSAGANIVFSHNEITLVQNAFALSKDTIGTTVEHNDVHDCHTGVRIESATADNIIQYNDIHDNTYAMRCGDEMGTGNEAHYNSFINNNGTDAGFPDYVGAVSNIHDTNTLSATLNYWGDSGGPSGVGPGTGDSVSDNVSFDPWLSCYQPQTETKIYITPTVVEKYALAGIEGSTFEVQVKVENIIDLYGFEFNVTWNSNLIKLVGVEYTSQLNQIWSQWTAPENKTGASWYQLVALALAPAVGFNGKGTLAKLTFRIEYAPCYIEPDYQLQARIHFAVVKLSDSDAQRICAEVHDGKYIMYAFKSGLKLRPTAITCRKLGETFTMEIKMIDSFKVSGFDIEIQYNTTLLEVDDVQWGNLSYFLPGPYIVQQIVRDDLMGLIRFHLVENVSDGAPLAYGDGILAAITFNVIKTKVWKNCLNWTNYIQDSITFKDWNITVMCPEIYHLTGELVYIIDADYQFLPIKGDVDSNGIVDIFDITAVAAYYGIEKGNPDYISDFDLNCDDIIDIYDLVLIGGNFGYEYDP